MAAEHQNILDNMATPSVSFALSKVPKLLTETRYRSAGEAIDRAEQIAPASLTVAVHRTGAAHAQKKIDAMGEAIRQTVALQNGALSVNGRKLDAAASSAVAGEDAALIMHLRLVWGNALLDQHKPADALGEMKLVSAIGQRVPRDEWDKFQPAANVPDMPSANPKGWTIRQFVVDALYDSAAANLAAGDAEEAAKAYKAGMAEVSNAARPTRSATLGYEIYQKLGPRKAGQYFARAEIVLFQMQDQKTQNQQTFQRGDQIHADYQAKIDDVQKRRRELEQRAAQLGSSDPRDPKVKALMEEQRKLDDEYYELIRQRNEAQIQNNQQFRPQPSLDQSDGQEPAPTRRGRPDAQPLPRRP